MPADEQVEGQTIIVVRAPTPLPQTYVGKRLISGDDPGLLRQDALPEEFYLREVADLDLSDKAAIVQFAERWGDLGLLTIEDMYEGFSAAFWELPCESLPPKGPLVRFRAVATALRDMGRIWLTVQGALSLSELDQSWESRAPAPTTVPAAMDKLVMALNAGLRPFQVYAAIEPGENTPGVVFPALASLCCLQLANDIAEKATYSRCHNERCGRLFHRQRGRAKAGQHHTKSVDYCSRSCALAQTQRNWRRNKRDRRQGS